MSHVYKKREDLPLYYWTLKREVKKRSESTHGGGAMLLSTGTDKALREDHTTHKQK
jgi:hypothetical protein